jgi:hypothetical protein
VASLAASIESMSVTRSLRSFNSSLVSRLNAVSAPDPKSVWPSSYRLPSSLANQRRRNVLSSDSTFAYTP